VSGATDWRWFIEQSIKLRQKFVIRIYQNLKNFPVLRGTVKRFLQKLKRNQAMNHDIDLQTARELISTYMEVYGKLDVFCYKKDPKLVSLLDQKNCVGLRIYIGQRKDGEKTLIIVGYDSNGKDINADLSEYLAEYGMPNVDITSPLMP
jgi:hypothetical protein